MTLDSRLLIILTLLTLCILTFGCSGPESGIISGPGGGWVASWEGYGNNAGTGVSVDSDGNVLLTGNFFRGIDIDPGPGRNFEGGFGLDRWQFLFKLDPDGELIWGNTWLGDMLPTKNYAVAGYENQIYVVGGFEDTVDFNPGRASVELTSQGGGIDLYLAAYTTDGDFSWVKDIGSAGGYSTPVNIIIDDAGSIYIYGHYIGTLNFDTEHGVESITTAGRTDLFFCKFDSSGELQWAKTWGGVGMDIAKGITTDGSSRIYVTGAFNEIVDFDPGPEDSLLGDSGISSLFTSIFDLEGNFIDVRSWEDNGYFIALDAEGNQYMAGYFYDEIDLDPGEGEDLHVSNGAGDVKLSKFDPDGKFLWGRTWGGPEFDVPFAIKVNDDGKVFIVGIFEGTTDFNAGEGIDTHTTKGDRDAFVTCYDADGNYHWTYTWGGIGEVSPESIAVDGTDWLYITGDFDGEIEIDTGEGTEVLDSDEGMDIFLLKLGADGSW